MEQEVVTLNQSAPSDAQLTKVREKKTGTQDFGFWSRDFGAKGYWIAEHPKAPAEFISDAEIIELCYAETCCNDWHVARELRAGAERDGLLSREQPLTAFTRSGRLYSWAVLDEAEEYSRSFHASFKHVKEYLMYRRLKAAS